MMGFTRIRFEYHIDFVTRIINFAVVYARIWNAIRKNTTTLHARQAIQRYISLI